MTEKSESVQKFTFQINASNQLVDISTKNLKLGLQIIKLIQENFPNTQSNQEQAQQIQYIQTQSQYDVNAPLFINHHDYRVNLDSKLVYRTITSTDSKTIKQLSQPIINPLTINNAKQCQQNLTSQQIISENEYQLLIQKILLQIFILQPQNLYEEAQQVNINLKTSDISQLHSTCQQVITKYLQLQPQQLVSYFTSQLQSLIQQPQSQHVTQIVQGINKLQIYLNNKIKTTQKELELYHNNSSLSSVVNPFVVNSKNQRNLKWKEIISNKLPQLYLYDQHSSCIVIPRKLNVINTTRQQTIQILAYQQQNQDFNNYLKQVGNVHKQLKQQYIHKTTYGNYNYLKLEQNNCFEKLSNSSYQQKMQNFHLEFGTEQTQHLLLLVHQQVSKHRVCQFSKLTISATDQIEAKKYNNMKQQIVKQHQLYLNEIINQNKQQFQIIFKTFIQQNGIITLVEVLVICVCVGNVGPLGSKMKYLTNNLHSIESYYKISHPHIIKIIIGDILYQLSQSKQYNLNKYTNIVGFIEENDQNMVFFENIYNYYKQQYRSEIKPYCYIMQQSDIKELLQYVDVEDTEIMWNYILNNSETEQNDQVSNNEQIKQITKQENV